MNLLATLVSVEVALAVVTFVALTFVTAPYGRHGRAGWGPTIPSRLGWVIMEAPAVLAFAWFAREAAGVGWVLVGMWQLHYVHRTFVFPFRTRSKRPMPVVVATMAFAFNCLNGGINGHWIAHAQYGAIWLADPRFLIGAMVFVAGMAINLHSDQVLIGLRRPGETGYKIPHGGMYRYVSCPNYLGETMQWVGFAIAAWSPAAAAFALYTAANLVPRARQHHAWYHAQFSDYPSKRRAIIPGLL